MKLLVRKPELVFFLVAIYCLISVTVRLLRQESLEIDESEQAFLSQFFLAGYGTQPPLYNWLQYIVSGMFGISVATLTIVKNGFLLCALLFYGLAARAIISDRALSMMAMLGILTVPAIFLLVQRDLSHTVAALFTVSLFLYGFLETLKTPRLSTYLMTGLAVGLGVLAKYNFVVIPVAAVIAILPEPELRKRFFDWRVLLAAAAAFAVPAPHIYWVFSNLALASGGTISEMKEGAESAVLPHAFHGLFALCIAIVKSIAIPAAVFGLVFYGHLKEIAKAESQWTRVIGRMLVACLVIVAVIVIGIQATHVREKWLVLFIILTPLYLAAKIDAAHIEASSRLPKFVGIVAFLSVGTVLMLFASVYAGPMIGRYSFAHTPYSDFTHSVLNERDAKPSGVVVDDRILAGNLKIEFPDTPVFLTYFPAEIGTLPVPAGPLLAVWSAESDDRQSIPPNIIAFLAKNGIAAERLESRFLSIPYHRGKSGDTYRFGYSWIERP